MIKKFVSLFFAFVLALTMIGEVSASDISIYDISGHTKSSTLSIANKTATCTSRYRSSGNDCESIAVVQTLEKHSWLFFWDTIGNERKTTVYSGDLSFINYKYNLESGTYRVKSVFTVKLKDGRSETVTVYSDEKTVS